MATTQQDVDTAFAALLAAAAVLRNATISVTTAQNSVSQAQLGYNNNLTNFYNLIVGSPNATQAQVDAAAAALSAAQLAYVQAVQNLPIVQATAAGAPQAFTDARDAYALLVSNLIQGI